MRTAVLTVLGLMLVAMIALNGRTIRIEAQGLDEAAPLSVRLLECFGLVTVTEHVELVQVGAEDGEAVHRVPTLVSTPRGGQDRQAAAMSPADPLWQGRLSLQK